MPKADPIRERRGRPASTTSAQASFSAEWTRLGKPPLAISETGVNKATENDNQASAWIGNLPEAVETMDVIWCVYFNRDSGGNGDWSITAAHSSRARCRSRRWAGAPRRERLMILTTPPEPAVGVAERVADRRGEDRRPCAARRTGLSMSAWARALIREGLSRHAAP
jgi:hypothetical protein